MVYYRNRIMYKDSEGGLILELFHNPNIHLYNKLIECKALYEELRMTGLVFDNVLYYPFKDLDILEQFDRIYTLEITISDIKNLDGLKYAPKLENLTLSNDVGINFSNVTSNLKKLCIFYHKKIINLEKLENLNKLKIYCDNNGVILPNNIQKLEFIKSKRTDLERLHSLKKLQVLEISYCSKIASLDTLPPCIKEIYIESCSKLINFDGLFNLQSPTKIVIRSKNISNDLKEQLKKKFPDAITDIKKI